TDANLDGDSNPLTATTDASGHATLTFTSSTAVTITVNASTTFQVDSTGVVVTRATGDSHAGDGGAASKTFVDANINLTPLTANNEVNHDHTVTATVLENLGQGGGFVAAPGAPVVFAVTGDTSHLTYTDANLDG